VTARDANGLYPATEPHADGRIDVGDGHLIHWEQCGNPVGKPAVVLHGGPGSGCTPGMRRYFDPELYRVILFDQRGCGRSTPHASDPRVDLSTNTTDHLVSDIERLRAELDIDRWLVLGWSWGSTLGLAYAQAHPGRVSELVLGLVVTTTAREVEWVTRDVGRFFPAEWARFRDGVPVAQQTGSLAEAYNDLLEDPDPSVRYEAARKWCEWEDRHVHVTADPRGNPRYEDPRFRVCFARLVTHYWRHTAWRGDSEILDRMHRIAEIPGALVHGRLDLSGPPDIAWTLAQAWPAATLDVVDGAGHAAGHPGIAERMTSATARFAEPERELPRPHW